MRNPITTAYNVLDDAIMFGVNGGVHLWNWTTGRTKRDLATLMNIGGFTFATAGNYFFHPAAGAIAALAFGYYNYTLFRMNKMFEKDERENANNEFLSLHLEFGKKLYESAGFCQNNYGVVLFWLANEVNDPNVSSYFSSVATGICLTGTAAYVMRADSLPPRKNVLSRAKDKLVDIVREHRREPAIEHVRY